MNLKLLYLGLINKYSFQSIYAPFGFNTLHVNKPFEVQILKGLIGESRYVHFIQTL